MDCVAKTSWQYIPVNHKGLQETYLFAIVDATKANFFGTIFTRQDTEIFIIKSIPFNQRPVPDTTPGYRNMQFMDSK
jgi:hypothetical protein